MSSGDLPYSPRWLPMNGSFSFFDVEERQRRAIRCGGGATLLPSSSDICHPSFSSSLFEPTPIAPGLNIRKKGGQTPMKPIFLRDTPDSQVWLSRHQPTPRQQSTRGSQFNGRDPNCRLVDEISPPETSVCTDVTSANLSHRQTLRKCHQEQWSTRFEELLDFKHETGHCLVPLEWQKNRPLSHWIKRQRSQYKAKQEGKHSTLTNERQEKLEELGFVWDTHKATWMERLSELAVFQEQHGHCSVPSRYFPNMQLSVWVKSQRRQYKLYVDGKKSNITSERIRVLTEMGFVWSPRGGKPYTPLSPTAVRAAI